MKEAELNKIIEEVAKEVMEKNKGAIDEDIRRMFKTDSEDGKIDAMDAVVRSTALCLTLLPSLSAAITARMLVSLGLVTLEDDK